MIGRTKTRGRAGYVALAVTTGTVLVTGLALALTAVAAPTAQGPAIPTPTLIPVADAPYTLTVVGGQDDTLTVPHADQDGFTLGQTEVRSTYPRGMLFTLRPQSTGGAIQDVILFIRYAHGSGTRAVAEASEDGTWTAHPWPTGNGQPAWTHFEFTWRVRDESGATVDSEPVAMDYFDPTREWFRVETPHYIVYWYNLSDSDPHRFAQAAAYAIAATHERRVAGFGGDISYKPIAVIYGSREAWDETYGGGVSNPTAGGLTSNALGMSVQYVSPGDVDFQVARMSHVITHELTHMFQFDVVGGATGPNWWTEGQAQWFSYEPGNYDTRLMNLATLQDFPTLSKELTRDIVQADGRMYLVYDAGASFVNWFVGTFGIDLHAGMVGLMKMGIPFYDSIEQVTGQSFMDLENQWRAYIGLPPFSAADLDPAAALQPIPDAPFAVGDTVTLPPSPPLPAVYEAPAPNAAYTGQCFANMQVTILQMGALDGVHYYQVDCMGQIGWMTGDQLGG